MRSGTTWCVMVGLVTLVHLPALVGQFYCGLDPGAWEPPKSYSVFCGRGAQTESRAQYSIFTVIDFHFRFFMLSKLVCVVGYFQIKYIK